MKLFFRLVGLILVIVICMLRGSLQPLPSLMHNQLVELWSITSPVAFGNLVSSYFYIYIIMQIPAAIVFQKYDFKKVFTTTSVILGLSVLLFAFAPNIWIGGIARVIEGIASAFIMIGYFAYFTRGFDIKWFPILVGVGDFVIALGSAPIQQIYIYFIDNVGWKHMVIYLGALIIILCILAFISVLLSGPLNESKKDKDGKEHKAFSIAQALQVVTNRKVLIPFLVFLVTNAFIQAFLNVWATPLVQNIYRYKFPSLNIPDHSVVYFNVASFYGIAFGALLLPAIATKINKFVGVLRLGCIVAAVAIAVFIYMLNTPNFTLLIGLLFIVGFSFGASMICLPLAERGARVGNKVLSIALVSIAGGASSILFQPIFSKILEYSSGGAKLTILDFQHSLLFILALDIFAAIIMFFVKEDDYKLNKNGEN